MTQGYKNVFTAEPVQWAADYVLGILETLEEGVQESQYGLDLLLLEREELRVVWQELIGAYPKPDGPVFYASGLDGARLFVIRQLLAALPPVKTCPLHDADEVFRLACRRLVYEFFILSRFHLSLDKKAPSTELVKRALQIVANRGVVEELQLNGHPLHIYCLDYELPEPACYFYLSHTILCGSSDFDAGRQLHCILHELGHVVYAARQAGRPQPSRLLRNKAAEQFANRFAASHLTPV